MAQLQMSARAILKLVENKQAFKHLLCEDEAVGHLNTIISKSRKFAKEDMKTALDELEQIVEGNEVAANQEEGAGGEGEAKVIIECCTHATIHSYADWLCLLQEAVLKPSNTRGGKAKGKKASKKKPTRSSRRKKVQSSSDEESEGLSELSEMEVDEDVDKENVNSPIAA